jgi:hypothetical protein
VATLEERAVECDVTGLRVLLRRNAEQRPPDPHFEPIERFVDRGILGDVSLIEVEYLPNLGQVLQAVLCRPVAVLVFDSITVNDEMNPAGEPAGGGLARMLPQRLHVRTKSRRSTSGISAFLGFIHTGLTVYPAAVPLFNAALPVPLIVCR